jgi:hypothetical protein
MKMRWGYILCVFIIIVLIIGLIYLLLYPPPVEDSSFGRIVKNANIFVPSLAALLAAVIALSAADPKTKKLKAHIETYITDKIENWKILYPKKELTTELRDFFKNCDEPITSHKVQFKITNTSNFDWVKPVVTFWLPVEKQHPQKKEQIYSSLSYNSNTYNTPANVKRLQMIDGVIISNSNLPYWKKKKSLTIWIKMALANHGSDPFDVEVSIDCENTNGFTKRFKINPEDLLKNMREMPISEEPREEMQSGNKDENENAKQKSG